ncbi:hypothetical protein ACQKE4_20490 [Halomonas sp. NPDC076908]|uniref:hypothetical protein n=1 Tax=Halomonas sp. NPDC076908 TaxID=3390567 RepID=UPI003D0762A8
MADMKSIPHIKEAIEKHLAEGGEVVLEYRYINAPSDVKYSFSTSQDFIDFLKS